MKQFINIFYGEEIKLFQSYTRKQKAVHLYVILSLALVFIIGCTSSIPLCILAALNLGNAINKGYKHIPDFGKEE